MHQLHEEQLKYRLDQAGKRYLANRQVAKRMRSLLEARLLLLAREYRRRYPAAKARRLALLDKRWREYIEAMVNLKVLAMTAKLEWDHCKMRLASLRSLRAFHRASRTEGN